METTTQINRQTGITLIELMITLVVAAILVSLAAPNFRGLIETNRISTLHDKMTASLQLARSEAINRSRTITLCGSNNQTTCSGTWSDGWIIFLDDNADRNFDSGTDTLLKASTVDNDGYSLVLISDVITTLQFNSEGRATARGSYQICGPSGNDTEARGIVVDFSGSTRAAADSNSDGIRETHQGVNISC